MVCNQQHRFMAAELLRAQGVQGRILLEPVGRNTAPAVALAALCALEDDPVLLVLPADHSMKDSKSLARAVEQGAKAANAGRLVCLGVKPLSPETGYGYLRCGEPSPSGVREVLRFEEKPDLETARTYMESGDCYWNSGIFLFKASAYLAALERHAPEMLAACRVAIDGVHADLDFIRVDKAAFEACPSDSVDYAVLEKETGLNMVVLDTVWSDLGSWSALHEAGNPDEEGNTLVGDVIEHDVRDSYLHSTGRLLTAVGVRDVVVVETSDAVLVANRNSSQDVKKIVSAMMARGRSEAVSHPVDYRPWGSFQRIDLGDRFQVKRITVIPGQKLSLQKHYHRAEHWIVVRGTALVVNGEQELLLHEDQSTYIPLGHVHRLENPGKTPLELIEVQTGSYLGEDDIVRLEDVYGREK